MTEDIPAFPVSTIDGFTNQGMSLRDWFAGQIAGGLAAHSGTAGDAYGPGSIAERSYEVADAMLAERAKALSPYPSQSRGDL